MSPYASQLLSATRGAFEAQCDPARAAPMAAYMKDIAPFRGIPTPERRALQRTVFAAAGRPSSERDVLDYARGCWDLDEREYQYAGQDFLGRHIDLCTPSAVATVELLIVSKSWWDTVDDLCRSAAGALVHRHPGALRPVMDRWLGSDDRWLIRSAILHMERWKPGDPPDVDVEWLFAACARHAAHRDFFVRKAIGWVMRTYAHRGSAEADRVRAFLAEHAALLSGLTKREALKRVRW